MGAFDTNEGRGAGAERAYSDLLDPALYAEFRAGGEEHIATAEAALLALERRPDDRAPLDDAFRAYHSLKGDAGCLGLAGIAHVTHAAESALALAREGTIDLTGPVADALLGCLDRLRRWIATVGDGPSPEVSKEARDLASSLEAAARAAPRRKGGAPVVAAAPAPRALAPEDPTPADGLPAPIDADAAESTTHATVRVDLERLDALLNLVGEVVICQAQAAEHPLLKRAAQEGMGSELTRLEKLIGDLQRISLSLRMTPVRSLLRKTRRIVRDLAHRSGKKVDLVLSGEDVELDRGVLAELADPLVHLVRNAIDHGIESPAARVAAGKPETATLSLTASARGGYFHVDVADDGRGIDVAKVRARAVQRGVIPADEPLSQARALTLIFAPGFSTSDTVTEISGRGVGLDVVRSRLERLHGHVAVDSKPSLGTTFALKLPLTLSVLDGMVVASGRERYVVPTAGIVAAKRLRKEDAATVCGAAETVRHEGAVLPLLRIERLMGLPFAGEQARPMVVILESFGRRAGLVVDEVLGRRQVVVKSLGDRFRGLAGVLGGTVLGDGRAGLILDVDGLVPGGAVERAA